MILSFGLLTACESTQVSPDYDDLERTKLRELHASSDGSHWLASSQTSQDHFVRTGQDRLGPFTRIEFANTGAYATSGQSWSFRAKEDAHVLVFVDGARYGPFDAVWPVLFDHGNWATITRTGAKLRILDSRGVSDEVDEIAGNIESDEEQGLPAAMPALGFLAGKAGWFAKVRKGSDWYVQSASGSVGPFDDVPNPVDEPGLTRDRSRWCIVGFREGKSWLVNAMDKFGPYDGTTGIVASQDGSHWIASVERAGKSFIRTEQGELGPFEETDLPAISADGSLRAFSFEKESRWFLRIGDHDSGPFEAVHTPSLSAHGKPWAAPIVREGRAYLLTSSGLEMGPYSFVHAPTYSSDASRWIAPAFKTQADGSTQTYLLTDRGVLGPFNDALPSRFVSEDGVDVYAQVREKGYFRVILNGEVSAPHGPFTDCTFPRIANDHHAWTVIGTQDAKRTIVRSDKIVGTHGPFDSAQFETSVDGMLTAIIGVRAGKRFVGINAAEHGPFDETSKPVLGRSGGRWAFFARSGSAWTVIHDRGVSPPFDEVSDLRFDRADRRLAYAYRTGTQWFAKIDEEVFGPFDRVRILENDGRFVILSVLESRVSRRVE